MRSDFIVSELRFSDVQSTVMSCIDITRPIFKKVYWYYTRVGRTVWQLLCLWPLDIAL